MIMMIVRNLIYTLLINDRRPTNRVHHIKTSYHTNCNYIFVYRHTLCWSIKHIRLPNKEKYEIHFFYLKFKKWFVICIHPFHIALWKQELVLTKNSYVNILQNKITTTNSLSFTFHFYTHKKKGVYLCERKILLWRMMMKKISLYFHWLSIECRS
jgi:hypothetical protein